ncbi:low molecular weight protein-tyrosine-phosphatase [Nocardioides psychrotolerans]|uniref:protein-tyrosine-phosphatase n=1 Tax=Nocardioides psychrotolerans TaxID=1005945 RepID=A0A1I3EB40_9ACTN|nr:low molecular weight protein-tyrosine-phosphatase [Nocardioides psychrotolerans]GEP37441.1 low molecular weight protein-tyrosine-phosphatase [Nocardioides psychrotolerans]SFH96207.1 protein-tyrosine phosphatase [Nocardioides psychrotolerans]
MPAATLPPARTPGQYAVALVCLGNICRSPMADVVLSDRVAAAGLADRVTVESCGTGDWHVGRRMDHRAAATLTSAGYNATRHRAQQLDDSWAERFDVLLAMDASNLAGTRSAASADGGAGERALLFRTFDPVDPGGEVPDPYYGGDSGFEEVLAMVERTTEVIVAALEQVLGSSGDRRGDRS